MFPIGLKQHIITLYLPQEMRTDAMRTRLVSITVNPLDY